MHLLYCNDHHAMYCGHRPLFTILLFFHDDRCLYWGDHQSLVCDDCYVCCDTAVRIVATYFLSITMELLTTGHSLYHMIVSSPFQTKNCLLLTFMFISMCGFGMLFWGHRLVLCGDHSLVVVKISEVRGCSGLKVTHWTHRNLIWVGASTGMWTQYLPT